MTHRLLFAIPFLMAMSVYFIIPVDAKAQIYFSAEETIRVIPTGDTESEFFFDADAWSLAVDHENGHIYWSEVAAGTRSEIKRANLDGTQDTVVVNQSAAIRGLALDLENDKIYWVDLRNEGKIYRADLNGENIEAIVEGEEDGVTDGTLDIALDLENDKIYWVKMGAIMRADLDGENVEVFVEITSHVQPSAIEVNPRDGIIYWVDTNSEMIMRADIGNGNAETLIDAVDPYGISVDVEGGKIYWIEDVFFQQAGRVLQANLDGTGAVKILEAGVSRGAIFGSGWEMPTSNEFLAEQPKEIKLNQNYPNPFNPQTVIEFHLTESMEVSLIVYNALGQLVTRIAENSYYTAGFHQIEFDASLLPSGIYIYQLRAGNFNYNRKMTLLK